MSAAADRPMGRGDITGRDAIPDDVHYWLGALERDKANRVEELDALVRAQVRRLSAPDSPHLFGRVPLHSKFSRACFDRPVVVVHLRWRCATRGRSGAGREPTLDHARPMATGPRPPGNTDNAGKVSGRHHLIDPLCAPGTFLRAIGTFRAHTPIRPTLLAKPGQPLDNVEHMRIASGALTRCETTDGGSMDRRRACRFFREPPRQGQPPTAPNPSRTVLLGLVAASATLLSVTSVALPGVATALTCSDERSFFTYKPIGNAYGTAGDIHPYNNYTPCTTGAVAHTVFLKLSPGFRDYVEGGAFQLSDTVFHPFAEWRVYPNDAVFRLSTHSISPTTYTRFRLRYHGAGTGFDVDWYASTGWETLSTTNQLRYNRGWAEQEVSAFGNSDLSDDHKNLLYMNNPTTQST